MLHISICDDESIMVQEMEEIVTKACNEKKIQFQIEKFRDGEEFLKNYMIRDDELIIMDIDMPIKSGIDVMKELEKTQRNEVVILVTAYDSLALDSMEYGPYWIVRKKTMQKDLFKAINSFLKMRSRSQMVLEIHIRNEIRHIAVKEIMYIEKYKHYSYIHLRDGNIIEVRKNIRDYESELAGLGFVRSHAAYIVSLRYCKEYLSDYIVLVDGRKIPISRERRKMTKEQFMISRRK